MTITPQQSVPVLTVSQITNAIKLSLEETFPSIWIQGEVSNCKLQASGHLYFSLKDAKAQIGAVMFRGTMSSLKALPKDGDQVIVHGELNVYPPSGRYQIVVQELRLAGLGELLQRLEELKAKLHKKGWFRAEHKKPLPQCPQRIGVVTSPTGAVIQDILHILTRRLSGFHLILNPVRVQGEGAAQEIAQAIRQFNAHDLVDVLIVGRGGGSIEDLWAFNEEIVAEAIFESRIPIISAVGHETDHCIADYVADVRAPTPSAAAEIVSAETVQLRTHCQALQQRLLLALRHQVRHRRQQLHSLLKQPLFLSPYTLLGPWLQQTDALRNDLDDAIRQKLVRQHLLLESRKRQLDALRPHAQIVHFRHKLVQWETALRYAMRTRLTYMRTMLTQKNDQLNKTWHAKVASRQRLFQAPVKNRQLDNAWQLLHRRRIEKLYQLSATLQTVNPKFILTKGYCILFDEKEGSVITSISAIKKKQEIRTVLADGSVISTVKDVFPNE